VPGTITASAPVQDLIEQFTTWAQGQTDVRSIMVLGSQARVDRPADYLSDLDLAVIVTDPSIYLSDITWLRRFGEPCLTFVESTAVGNFREQRVLFKDGRDVDVSLLPAFVVERMIEQQVPAEIADVLSRGFRILVDKDGLAEQLTGKARWAETVDKLPTESKWRETSHDFLYHVVWAAKKARRGELWVAKSSCDGYQKNLLLLLIEWHAKMKGQYDTWHKGRFLERWADPAILQELPGTLPSTRLRMFSDNGQSSFLREIRARGCRPFRLRLS
jgi:aminoglycoside 6-adenylyltransferase